MKWVFIFNFSFYKIKDQSIPACDKRYEHLEFLLNFWEYTSSSDSSLSDIIGFLRQNLLIKIRIYWNLNLSCSLSNIYLIISLFLVSINLLFKILKRSEIFSFELIIIVKGIRIREFWVSTNVQNTEIFWGSLLIKTSVFHSFCTYIKMSSPK